MQYQSKKIVGAFLSILLLTSAIGYYTSVLNLILYAHEIPVYDSMAYTNKLAAVMHTTQDKGLAEALKVSLNDTTVFLPWLFGIILSPWLEASRLVGVWIQTGQLLLMLLSLFFYFHTIRKQSFSKSLIMLIPFLSLAGLYSSHGGLSDFRMDIGLYLWFSTAITWFLIATHTSTPKHWCLLGAAIGVTCLNRATAPVYFIVTLTPLIILRCFFLNRQELKKYIINLLLCGIIVFIVCGWFYWFNFDYLHFYYVVWNPDANAQLSLAASIHHIIFLINFIGWLAIFWLAAWFFANVYQNKNFIRSAGLIAGIKTFSWYLLYIGIAPVGFLILRGAGPNPYVVFPSAFGLILFCLFPLNDTAESYVSNNTLSLTWGILGLAMFALVLAAGVHSHAHTKYGSMKSFKKIPESIIVDAKSNNLKRVNFTVAFNSATTNSSIQNVLIYDLGGRVTGGNAVAISNITLQPKDFGMNISAPPRWNKLKGDTDVEKINFISKCVNKKADYVVFPTSRTIAYLEEFRKDILINNYVRDICNAILAGGEWNQISDEIDINGNEAVIVFHNQRKHNFYRSKRIKTSAYQEHDQKY